MDPLLWHPWFVACVIVAAVVLMIRGRSPDFCMLGAVIVLVVARVIDAATAVRGFGNEGVLSVAALFIVAAGLQNTGTIAWVSARIFRHGSTIRATLARTCFSLAGISAFLNNTPLVAILTPAAINFAKRERFSPSKLLMPLCFATTLGGTLTLIGTSTNLVVAGLVEASMGAAHPTLHPLSFFEVTWVGAPLAIFGVAYLVLAANKLIPERIPVITPRSDPRQYTARLTVAPGGVMDGRTIAAAGLRRLEGLFLVEIDRGGEAIAAPPPEQLLRGNDQLIFAGDVDNMVALRSMAGLLPESGTTTPATSRGRTVVEAVVSNSFPGLGQTIRAFGFRSHYDAAVIAVARNGQRVLGRIGDIELEAGDTVLIETGESFLPRNRTSRDFFLMSEYAAQDVQPARAPLAILILLAMVVVATITGNMLAPALAAAIAMVVTGCVRVSDARNSIELSVLIVIAAGLGLSSAVTSSGLGATLGSFIVNLATGSPIAMVATIYIATVILTNFITNAAAAAVIFPLALATADQAHCDPMPFIMAVLFAASAAFATPLGYQTNLMIYGPGGYRFSDFCRYGLPLQLVAALVTIVGLALQYGLWTTTPTP